MNDQQHSNDDFATRFDAGFARLQVTLLEACEKHEPWPLKVAAAIRAALDFAAADPAAARVLTVEAMVDRGDGGRRYQRTLDYLSELLGAGAPHDVLLPASTERALVGGIAMLIADHLLRDQPDQLASLAPGLIEFTLLPYLGALKAKRWARRSERSNDG